jgi:hypothetical protein
MDALPDENLALIDDIEGRDSRLNDWERKFVDSLRNQLESGRGLTTKQIEALVQVWERATAKG